MERDTGASSSHVLVFPFPLQGHINPMFQFCKRLASKGLHVTLLTTTPSIIQLSMHTQSSSSSSISLQLLSPDDHLAQQKHETLEAYVERFRIIGSQSLAQLFDKYAQSSHPARFLVYDSVILWAQDVADLLGVDAAPFFTQSCAVSAIYYHGNHGTFKLPLHGSSMVSLPPLPPLSTDHDMPSLIKDMDSYPDILKINLNQFSYFHKVKFVFFNTFHKLELEVPFIYIDTLVFIHAYIQG